MEIKIDTKKIDNNIYFIDEVNSSSFLKLKQDIIRLNNEFDSYNEDLEFKLKILKLPYEKKPHNIILHLSTYGGYIDYGFAIYDLLKANKYPIDIICSGPIMSAGIAILCGGRKKIANKLTTFMIHSVSNVSYGKLNDIEEKTNELKRINNILYDIICKNTNITNKRLIKNKTNRENWYFDAKTALKLKLIDEII